MGVTWSEEAERMAYPSNKSQQFEPRRDQQPEQESKPEISRSSTLSSPTSPSLRTSGRARKPTKKLLQQFEGDYDDEEEDDDEKPEFTEQKPKKSSNRKRPRTAKSQVSSATKKESRRRPTKKARSSPGKRLPPPPHDSPSSHPLPPTWLDKYQQLLAYHKVHKNCQVPQNVQYAKLARWVCYQKKSREEGKLSAIQIRKLDQLGFDWTYVRKARKRPSFEDKCKELEAFKKKYKHLNVPSTGKYDLLGSWLYCMRRRRLGEYKRCRKLTPQQIERLDRIGIEWSLPGREGGYKREEIEHDDDDDDGDSEEESSSEESDDDDESSVE